MICFNNHRHCTLLYNDKIVFGEIHRNNSDRKKKKFRYSSRETTTSSSSIGSNSIKMQKLSNGSYNYGYSSIGERKIV